jgi:cysteine desulfurase
MTDAIYLDNNSTTPLMPQVAGALQAALAAGYVNPASQHQAGQRARRVLQEARESILALLGAKTSGMAADRLIFTSGGTEANNLLLRGYLQSPPARLIVSRIEHPSVIGVARYLSTRGVQVDYLQVTSNGVIDLDQAAALLAHSPPSSLVCVMLANNETGVVQPLSELAQLCQRYGAALATDAVQAIGKLDLDLAALGVAALTIAPHKFHGPLGIGALLIRGESHFPLAPILFGGFQQEGLRPGTESVALALGFQAALAHAVGHTAARQTQLRLMRDRFETLLRAALGDQLVINGQFAPRLPNTSNLAFLGLDRQELLLALDMAGVACATGSACASGSSEPSAVLMAMGLPQAVISGSLRFSFGALNTVGEAEEATRRILRVVKDLRARQNRRNSPAPPRQDGR